MIHQFDHRWLSFDASDKSGHADAQRRAAPNFLVAPRYWVPESEVQRRREGTTAQFIVRRITRVTDERSVISALIPECGISDSATLLVTSVEDAIQLVAAFNSFALDFFARQKLAGVTLSPYILRQFAVPSRRLLASPQFLITSQIEHWIRVRSLELTYTAWDLEAFALDCGYSGPPFRWDEERRFLLRCELDAAYFHLYLGSPGEWGTDSPQLREMFPTPRDAVDYIMDTFPIVRRKAEQAHGEYRTKRVILEIYDQMAEAIRTGHSYQTRLTPPPGPPTDADGNFIPMAEWDPNNWPEHIHPPKKEG